MTLVVPVLEASPSPFHAVRAEIRAALRAHGLLAAIVAAQFATALGLQSRYGRMTDPAWSLQLSVTTGFFAPILTLCVVIICFAHVVRAKPRSSATLALLGELRRYATDRRRLAHGLPVVALLIPFSMIFSYLKVNIPNINPFSWDSTFERWDRVLFFGRPPFEVLQPVMAVPFVTFLTYIAYNAWFMLMWCSLIACAFMRSRSDLRTRYLAAFMLVWFVQGNLMAIVFSSAGPCFYEALGHLPNPYAPLMHDLRAASAQFPMLTLAKQQLLWSGYRGEIEPMGVSAMPSLHNAIAILMALAARHFGRRVAIVFAAYAAWIYLGSISLGWHYAVDGLVALPTTVALWFLAGRLAGWWDRASSASGPIRAAG